MKKTKNIMNNEALKSNIGFNVPENYFDNLSDCIHLKISEKKKNVYSIKSIFRYAAAIFFFILSIGALIHFSNGTNQIFENQIGVHSNINKYEFIADFYEITTDDVIDYMAFLAYPTQDITEEEIIEYLLDNNIYYFDIQELIE